VIIMAITVLGALSNRERTPTRNFGKEERGDFLPEMMQKLCNEFETHHTVWCLRSLPNISRRPAPVSGSLARSSL